MASLKILPISLLAALAVWGVALSPNRTFSVGATSGPFPKCRVGGADFRCQAPYDPSFPFLDPLATSAQELPADIFLHFQKARFGRMPRWNPYIGSGYPAALDQINNVSSPTRWFLQRFPGDGSRDWLIFARVVIWTLGILASVWLLGIRHGWTLFWIGLGAAGAPYFCGFVDIIYLDLDCLIPCLITLPLAAAESAIPGWASVTAGLFLGAWIGLLGFAEAQASTGIFFGAVVLFLFAKWRKTWPVAVALGLGFLGTFPFWLPPLRFLPYFRSLRDAERCIASYAGIPWREMPTLLLAPQLSSNGYRFVGTLAGLTLIASVAGRGRYRSLNALFVAVLVVVCWGIPYPICRIPLISGIRFDRHSLAMAQALFLIVLGRALALWETEERRWILGAVTVTALLASALARGPWSLRLELGIVTSLAALLLWLGNPPPGRRQATATLLTMAVMYFSNHLFFHVLRTGGPRQSPPPVMPLASTAIGQLHRLSAEEDRRHFSPHGILGPNWSQAYEILDLRLLEGLYPARYYDLNAQVFGGWVGAHEWYPPYYFASPVPPSLAYSLDFQRLMILHRVSLLSFFPGEAFFAEGAGPYRRESCERRLRSSFLEVYLCPEVGGVGFFPKAVERRKSWGKIVDEIRHTEANELIDKVWIADEDLPGTSVPLHLSPAAGRVLAVKREPDSLRYQLKVEQPGVFAIADTFFPGWHAFVGTEERPLFPVNHAFKGVMLPPGDIELNLKFDR